MLFPAHDHPEHYTRNIQLWNGSTRTALCATGPRGRTQRRASRNAAAAAPRGPHGRAAPPSPNAAPTRWPQVGPATSNSAAKISLGASANKLLSAFASLQNLGIWASETLNLSQLAVQCAAVSSVAAEREGTVAAHVEWDVASQRSDLGAVAGRLLGRPPPWLQNGALLVHHRELARQKCCIGHQQAPPSPFDGGVPAPPPHTWLPALYGLPPRD